MVKNIDVKDREKGTEVKDVPEVIDPAETARQEAVREAATEQLAADTAQAHQKDLEKAAAAHDLAKDIAVAVGHPLDFIATTESAPVSDKKDELDEIAAMEDEEVPSPEEPISAEQPVKAPVIVSAGRARRPLTENLPGSDEFRVPQRTETKAPEKDEEAVPSPEEVDVPEPAPVAASESVRDDDDLDAIENMSDEESAPVPEEETEYESAPTVIPDSETPTVVPEEEAAPAPEAEEGSAVEGAEVAAAAVAAAEALRNPSAIEAVNRAAERGIDAVVGTAGDVGGEVRGAGQEFWTGRRSEGPSVIHEASRLGARAIDRPIEDIKATMRDLGKGYEFAKNFDRDYPKTSKAIKQTAFAAILAPALLYKGFSWGVKKAWFGLKWLYNEIVPGFQQLIGQKETKLGETPEANVKLLEEYKKAQEAKKKKEEDARKKK